jgi:hypothetical protein
MPPLPCMLVCAFSAQIAHETAGAACTRLSLRPCFSWRAEVTQSSGAFQPRERGRIPSRCLTVESDRLAACIAEYEIDRMRGNLPKLSLIAEGPFEHRQSARHGDDV